MSSTDTELKNVKHSRSLIRLAVIPNFSTLLQAPGQTCNRLNHRWLTRVEAVSQTVHLTLRWLVSDAAACLLAHAEAKPTELAAFPEKPALSCLLEASNKRELRQGVKAHHVRSKDVSTCSLEHGIFLDS